MTWKSQYVNIPPHGTVNNNITISALEDAPLGDVSVMLGGDGYDPDLIGVAYSFNLKVVDSDSWGFWFAVDGSQPHESRYFTCSHGEWRVLWRYVPRSESSTIDTPPPPNSASRSEFAELSQYAPKISDAEIAQFNLTVYRAGEGAGSVASIVKMGTEETSGAISIHETGTFYMKITAANTENYAVFVEENLIDIPEFPSWASLVLAFATPMVIVLVCQRRLASAKKHQKL